MKVNLSTIGSGYGATSALNANFDAIEAAIENTLSRDGTTPNEMEANLDMNDNNILNVGALDVASLTINGTPVQPSTGVTVASAFQSYTFTATAGQTSFSVSPFTPYVASVQVEVNGLSLPPAEISVSGTNVVIPACSAGDEVVIRRYTDAPSPFPSASDISFNQAGTIQTRTVQSKLRDVVSVKDFGAVGDGIADDTAAIQACYTANAGKIIDHGNGYTYLISSSLTLYSGSKYIGKSIIKQKNGAGIANPMLSGVSVSNVVVDGLEIDGNAANNAAAQTYGIKFLTGTNNIVQGCNVHDVTQAGIYFASETYSKVLGNQVINCGRNLGTDNHGIMLISNIATALTGIVCQGNTVVNAYRKGITVYSATPGTINGVSIDGNVVNGCATGGIYTANSSAVTHGYQRGICITGNVCYNNYVNIEADCMIGGVVAGNTCDTTSGGQGIYSADCIYSSFTGNTVINSQADGIKIIGLTINPTGITVSGNTIALSSQASAGTYDGLDLNGVTYSTIVGNVMLGESASPKQGYGIQESGSSDFNMYANNRIANTQTGTLAQFVGANNAIQSASGRQTSINAATPNNTFDINGGLSIRDQSITVVNGANNNVALPSNAGTLYTNGPTGAYNISGIAGGVSGRKITLMNYTTQTMTLNHNSGSSSAGNKILIGGSADLAISGFGAAELTYISGASAWVVTGVKT